MLDDKARLQHILDAILEIEEYMTTHTETDFFSNSMLSSACIRQLEVIGEAAGRVSEETKAESADIPWKEVVGLRNVLNHEYFGVDLDLVFDVIRTDMPTLKNGIKALLEAQPE
ncbi:MAG: DUF86 domain-containing protein [Candidatus Electrothrix sp. LOE2]|jgi:uncharacterized protein with HEPN domain|nr:DUF86 domain-containing protein [Candidatus Electrothrix sp. LOE2]